MGRAVGKQMAIEIETELNEQDWARIRARTVMSFDKPPPPQPQRPKLNGRQRSKIISAWAKQQLQQHGAVRVPRRRR